LGESLFHSIALKEVRALEKKTYTTPQLVVHGEVETITRKGGGTLTDVPQGTPVTDNVTRS